MILSWDVPGQRSLSRNFCSCPCPGTVLGSPVPECPGKAMRRTVPLEALLHRHVEGQSMGNFYICNVLLQNLANSESVISKNCHVWFCKWPISSGLKNKFDPSLERSWCEQDYKRLWSKKLTQRVPLGFILVVISENEIQWCVPSIS